MDHFDVAIIGAGVVGLAVAQRLTESPRTRTLSTVVLEQESSFGQHTSSRNSEVIHGGIYYAADSLKARLCVRGKALLVDYCQRFHVPYSLIGKYIVAGKDEVEELELLQHRARSNGVDDLRWVDEKALEIAEPAVKAHSALFSPSSGIVDSHSYMFSLLQQAEQGGALFSPRTRVLEINPCGDGFLIECEIGTPNPASSIERYQFKAEKVINSAGLNAMEIAARIDGVDKLTLPILYPCKGDYFSYRGRSPFTHLIYPMPEANTAGLGIHATLDLAGRVRFGPDANYIDSLNFDIDADKADLFATRIARYFPAIKAHDLEPDYAGIRPKLSAPGEPAKDFQIQDASRHHVPGLIQLFGIESPGLTASLAIAEEVIELMLNE